MTAPPPPHAANAFSSRPAWMTELTEELGRRNRVGKRHVPCQFRVKTPQQGSVVMNVFMDIAQQARPHGPPWSPYAFVGLVVLILIFIYFQKRRP